MQESCPLWFNYLSLQILEWFQQRRCVAHEARMWTLWPRTERFPAMREYLSAWTEVPLRRDGGRRERGVRMSPHPPAPEPVAAKLSLCSRPAFSVYTSVFLTLEGGRHPVPPCVPSIQLQPVIAWCPEPNDPLKAGRVARVAPAACRLALGSPWSPWVQRRCRHIYAEPAAASYVTLTAPLATRRPYQRFPDDTAEPPDV